MCCQCVANVLLTVAPTPARRGRGRRHPPQFLYQRGSVVRNGGAFLPVRCTNCSKNGFDTEFARATPVMAHERAMHITKQIFSGKKSSPVQPLAWQLSSHLLRQNCGVQVLKSPLLVISYSKCIRILNCDLPPAELSPDPPHFRMWVRNLPHSWIREWTEMLKAMMLRGTSSEKFSFGDFI